MIRRIHNEQMAHGMPRVHAELVAVANGEIHGLAREVDDPGRRVELELISIGPWPTIFDAARETWRSSAAAHLRHFAPNTRSLSASGVGLDADRQGTAHGTPIERLHGARELIEAVAYPGQQCLAGYGELHGSVQAHEQGYAEIGLQRAHLLSDRRGGDVKLLRRPAEAHVSARRLEGPERVEGRNAPFQKGNRFFSDEVVIVRCPQPNRTISSCNIVPNRSPFGFFPSRGKLS